MYIYYLFNYYYHHCWAVSLLLEGPRPAARWLRATAAQRRRPAAGSVICLIHKYNTNRI